MTLKIEDLNRLFAAPGVAEEFLALYNKISASALKFKYRKDSDMPSDVTDAAFVISSLASTINYLTLREFGLKDNAAVASFSEGVEVGLKAASAWIQEDIKEGRLSKEDYYKLYLSEAPK